MIRVLGVLEKENETAAIPLSNSSLLNRGTAKLFMVGKTRNLMTAGFSCSTVYNEMYVSFLR
jgi:molybdopterin/thiamine biosynthesis adenylyltransferase